MFITVLNDCKSQNDIGRQETRLISLLNAPVSFVGVSSDFSVNATLEAAGNLIDILDGAEGREGVVIVNVAPRGEKEKDGENGSPFCYFHYKQTLIISTVRGYTLSLAKKLGLSDSLNIVDVPTVVKYAYDKGLIDERLRDYIPITQFRSYDFEPRLAAWLLSGHDIPHEKKPFSIVSDIPDCIWYIDDFGNCKTTLLAAEIESPVGSRVKTSLGEFTYYHRLKDLPKGETAMYVGSAGLEGKRFIEVATQMHAGSAAATLDVKVGSEFIIEG